MFDDDDDSLATEYTSSDVFTAEAGIGVSVALGAAGGGRRGGGPGPPGAGGRRPGPPQLVSSEIGRRPQPRQACAPLDWCILFESKRPSRCSLH